MVKKIIPSLAIETIRRFYRLYPSVVVGEGLKSTIIVFSGSTVSWILLPGMLDEWGDGGKINRYIWKLLSI